MSTPRTLVATIAIGIVVAFPRPAQSQEINLATLDEGSPNYVHFRTGGEYGFVAGVGYARALPFLGRTILLGGDLTAPLAGLDNGDYRLRAGALVPIVGAHQWKLAGSLEPTLRAASNDVGSMISLGADVGAVGGYYATGWFVAGELGFDYAALTHIVHSDRYRNLVFAGARDGWYSNPGGNYRLGVQAGLSFARYDLVLRVGQLRDMRGEKPMLPLYGTLTFDTRW